jgi:sulfite exporter TauE/SafE
MSNGNKRPTVAVVLGILNIAFGVLGICGGIVGLISQFSHGMKQSEIPANLQNWMHVVEAIRIVLCVALIASGIGLLMVKNWGRLLAMIYAIVDIPVALVNSALTAKTIEPVLKQLHADIPPEMHGPLVIGAVAGGVCCGLIYPIVLLILLNLKDIRAAFAASSSVPPPVSPPSLGG